MLRDARAAFMMNCTHVSAQRQRFVDTGMHETSVPIPKFASVRRDL